MELSVLYVYGLFFRVVHVEDHKVVPVVSGAIEPHNKISILLLRILQGLGVVQASTPKY